MRKLSTPNSFTELARMRTLAFKLYNLKSLRVLRMPKQFLLLLSCVIGFANANAQVTVVSSNLTLSAGVHFFPDHIYITNGATLTLASGAEVQMSSGKSIFVSTSMVGGNVVGSNLILNPNSKITVVPVSPPALASPWAGIQVWGQPQFSQLTTGGIQRQSRVIANGATIEFAQVAIRNFNYLNDFNGGTTGGGIIQATGTTFRNNGVSVVMNHYQNFNPFNASIKWNDYSFFTNCTFTRDANIITVPSMDILVHEVHGVRINGCDFINRPEWEGISNIKAIRSNNGGFILDQACNAAGPLTPGNPCPPQDLKRSHFVNYAHAVECFGLLDFKKIIIRNTDFENCRFAVRVQSFVNPEITSNHFVMPYIDGVPTIQLDLIGCTQFRVEENLIEQNPPFGLPTFSPNYGIIINNSGQNYNEVYGNVVSNIGYHHQALNVNRWIADPRNNTGLNYLCNNNNTALNGAFDFVVDQVSSPGFFGIGGHQGFQSTSTFGFDASRNTFGNKTLPSSFQNHFKNEGIELMYYHEDISNEIPIYYEGITPLQRFGPECTSRWNQLPKDLAEALSDLLVDLTNYRSAGFHEADPTSEEFLRYQTTYNEAAFYQNALIGQLGSDTAINFGAYLDILMADGMSHFENSWLAALLNQWAAFGESYGTDLMASIDYTGLSTETELEGSLIAAYLQINRDLRDVSYADSALTYDLYAEVTSLMGQGNYWAKSLGQYYLSAFFDTVLPAEYVHYSNYSPRRAPEELLKASISELEFKYYPNPIQDYLYLELPTAGSYTATITDLTGKLLHTYQLSPGKQSVDMTHLPAGVYLMQLQADAATPKTVRLIKQ
jgi:hypothetical protein